MNRRSGNGWSLAGVLVAGLLATASCAQLGGVLEDGQGTTLDGEVRSLDTRRARLSVRDDYSGRTETVRYDGRTSVVYRQRQYPVSALERGDRVRIRLAQGRNGEWYADRIEVRESVSDGRSTRTQRLDGTVTQVDVRRGVFTLQQSRASTYVVYVPERVSREDERRFTRLRRGDRARADVRLLGRGQAELIRFR